ncbi:glycosyltransferase family 4 protein [Acidithiobacillus montserratensis]|uniref:Glycosyltransferase family 4 protein n=1 Tax=Acidithiobacillus montserratensis TaxID=2729135 RepID=A0ACD5HII8_9PROT|nr:glycosyltransferase family 4 protein [Acidithiobacillus montserratensis]MBU2746746.1 glycosyltransferase family 4 protein [Acidithiobacillus montserratensis]
MKILLSIHHPISIEGGAPGVTRKLAQEFSLQGHDVRVLSFDDMPRRFHGKLAQVVFPWFVADHVRRTHYDVMDLSSGDGWRLKPGNFSQSLIVFRSHGLEHVSAEQRREAALQNEIQLSWKYPLYHGGWRLREVAQSMRNAELSLFLNKKDHDFAIARLSAVPSRCEIVPNGLPSSFLHLPLSDEPVAGTPLRIAMVGGYLQRKGFSYALEAFRRLLARHSLLEVGFFGIGQGNAALIEKELGNAGLGRVNYVENYNHEDLPKLLGGYHVLLFPSLSEGFAMAPLESMACGLALITTSVGGLPEQLRSGHEAIIIPPANTVAIEHSLETLFNDRSLLQRLRKAGQVSAQKFSWESIASDQLALYAEHLEKKCLFTAGCN